MDSSTASRDDEQIAAVRRVALASMIAIAGLVLVSDSPNPWSEAARIMEARRFRGFAVPKAAFLDNIHQLGQGMNELLSQQPGMTSGGSDDNSQGESTL